MNILQCKIKFHLTQRDQPVCEMGSTASSSHAPSIRDQAIEQCYFPLIPDFELQRTMFTKYGIRITKIDTDQKVFTDPMTGCVYTNKDFNNTVCSISFPAGCKLVPAPDGENGNDKIYDLVDPSCEQKPNKLISAWVHEEKTDDGKIALSLKYWFY